MNYGLGVDLGTTFTGAAVERSGVIEMFNLGASSAAIPSVVLLDGGVFAIGEVADQRSSADPSLSAREFKRRVGDPAPILVGGSPYAPHLLMGRLLAGVLAAVSEREGGPPDRIALTHPANWGEFRRELFVQMARSECGDADVTFLTEPEAAALDYAHRASVPDGSVIAVYDLGGGTFDAAILRRHGEAFSFLGSPEGVEHLGGLDFDAALLNLVTEHAGLTDLDSDDGATIAAMHQLRRACIEAKIALSSSTDATIPIFIPGAGAPSVRITRAEFEDLIGPSLDESVRSLQRAVGGAGLTPADLHSVLLVGGSSRIPLVAQRVTNALGRPVAVDADPKNTIARGAARATVGESASVPVVPAAVAGLASVGPNATDPPPRTRRTAMLVGAAALLVAVVGGGLALTQGGDDDAAAAPGTPLCKPNSTDGVFVLGIAAPRTGIKADLAGIENGALLAVEDINQAGGVLGTPIEITVADTGDADDSGRQAFSRLDGDDSDVVIGPVSSSLTRAIAPLLSNQCMVTISPSATATDLAVLDDDNLFFRTIGTTGDEARIIVEQAGEGGKITLVRGAGTFSDELQSDLEEQAGTVGAEVDSVDSAVSVDPGSAGTVVLSFANTTPEARTPSADIATLLDIGVPANRIVVVEVGLQDIVDEMPERTDDLIGLSIIAPGAGIPAALDSRLPESDEALYAPEAYDAVVIAALAAESGATDDPVQIASRLGAIADDVGTTCRAYDACLRLVEEGVDISYEGQVPTLSFDANGDPGRATFLTQTIDSSGAVVTEFVVAERPR